MLAPSGVESATKNLYVLAATVDLALKLVEIATHCQGVPLGGIDDDTLWSTIVTDVPALLTTLLDLDRSTP